jgi:hypothetical protein
VGDVSRFKNFDMIFPTEKEARISTSMMSDSIETDGGAVR